MSLNPRSLTILQKPDPMFNKQALLGRDGWDGNLTEVMLIWGSRACFTKMPEIWNQRKGADRGSGRISLIGCRTLRPKLWSLSETPEARQKMRKTGKDLQMLSGWAGPGVQLVVRLLRGVQVSGLFVLSLMSRLGFDLPPFCSY